MKLVEKQKATSLRKNGKSIKEIARLVGVSKASVSVWVRDIILTKNQKTLLKKKGFTTSAIEKRRISRLKNEQAKKNIVVNEAQKDFSAISPRDLKIIGAMLYWAEGGKTRPNMVRIANSDPEMISIMMSFFRKICNVPEKKFRGHIHTHSLENVNKSEKFWSKVSGIPTSQFFKTYTKPSVASKNKRHSLPHGTFDIYVCDTQLFLKIRGWIRAITSLAANHKDKLPK